MVENKLQARSGFEKMGNIPPLYLEIMLAPRIKIGQNGLKSGAPYPKDKYILGESGV